jgi:hypothetical protein
MPDNPANADHDIVAIFPRPAPVPKFDYVAAVPEWPGWQLEEFTSIGLLIQQFWTNFEGQVYMLKQWTEANPHPVNDDYDRYAPVAKLFALVGHPRPGNWNWTLRDVAGYELPEVQPGNEARKEIAAYRRRLPELLAELPEKQKAKIFQSQQRSTS